MFGKHKILPFKELVLLEQCKLGYKLCHDLLPTNLAKSMKHDHRMQSILKTHNYPTRYKYIPNLPQALSSKYRSSFLFRAIKEFSNLNSTLKNCKTLDRFNRHYTKAPVRLYLYLVTFPLLNQCLICFQRLLEKIKNCHFQAYDT